MWCVISLLFIIGVSDYYRLSQFTSATLSNLHTVLEAGNFLSVNRRLNKQLEEQAAELENEPATYDYEPNSNIQNNKYLRRSIIYDDNVDSPLIINDYLDNSDKALRKQDYADYNYISNTRQPYKKLNDKTEILANELNKFGKKIEELQGEASKVKQNKENFIDRSFLLNENKKLLTAQKKGQSEFVEFIDPHSNNIHQKALKNVERLEKRRLSSNNKDFYQSFTTGLLSSSGNIIFLGLVAFCCLFSVVGVVGGIYYFKRARTIRENSFDDFTRYSPTGPGRDRQKQIDNKNKLGFFNNINGNVLPLDGEKGDDELAYKAQLHHYQQTKQKIIGIDPDGAQHQSNNISDKSEDEDETDLEHNFSVYECPGLAPTCDIEVQNPNFIDLTTK